ncbi:MAG TPA: serine/threonine-protein kinase [Polyangiaceae bacterium LLY-WYZ-15_(1-7)]|nr:serine/threonine-protein kinase [Polyangiaceae bacterium LLY-WYZ-15_(1-7)]HJL10433.1 serine/threonine-protein kinase [Polyangiaceae bacterium LLY-WYZ-15_(1-7)]
MVTSPSLAAPLRRRRPTLPGGSDTRPDGMRRSRRAFRRWPAIAGRFRPIGDLARGGMGRILRCEDAHSGEVVAVKVALPEDVGGASWRQRFERECLAASRVRSEHVPRVVDVGEDPEVGPYLAMELLEGETLSRRLSAGGALDAREAISLGIQLADALLTIRAAGILHRDLKPSNVQLVPTPGGLPRVVLLDFGICRFVDELADGHGRLTAPGRPVGTLRYMAPERLFEPERVDTPADVYGLGAVLFVALTGRRPFPHVRRGSTRALIEAIVAGDHPEPRELAPAVPEALSALVGSTMDRDPEARPTLAEFRDALLELEDPTELDLRPPPFVRTPRDAAPRAPSAPPAPPKAVAAARERAPIDPCAETVPAMSLARGPGRRGWRTATLPGAGASRRPTLPAWQLARAPVAPVVAPPRLGRVAAFLRWLGDLLGSLGVYRRA